MKCVLHITCARRMGCNLVDQHSIRVAGIEHEEQRGHKYKSVHGRKRSKKRRLLKVACLASSDRGSITSDQMARSSDFFPGSLRRKSFLAKKFLQHAVCQSFRLHSQGFFRCSKSSHSKYFTRGEMLSLRNMTRNNARQYKSTVC